MKRTLRASFAFVIFRYSFCSSQGLAQVDGECGVDDAGLVFATPCHGVGAVEGAKVKGLAVDDGLIAGDRDGGGE